jgi:hypothetical protein
MDGEVIHLASCRKTVDDDVPTRLRRMGALLEAIDSGELLAALPDCALARRNHLTALDLLHLLNEELLAIRAGMEA